MQYILEKVWYGASFLSYLLWPFSCVYSVIVECRRLYLIRWKQRRFSIPIIVVGNLTVGGVGKTPLVITLVRNCQSKGLKVGVVSRGYKASLKKFPHCVRIGDTAQEVGDEPLLLATTLKDCPVVIAPKRVEAVAYLLENYILDLIISDDGLQHYAMGRALEIVVVDGIRKLGNGFCLPAGPLRERSLRLKKADLIVYHTAESSSDKHTMVLEPLSLKSCKTGIDVSWEGLKYPVAAVAGIGHPQRFFNTLITLGIPCNQYAFPDHHFFQRKDFNLDENTVIMTEKDAIKCMDFAEEHWYFLPIKATVSDSFWKVLWSHPPLKRLLE